VKSVHVTALPLKLVAPRRKSLASDPCLGDPERAARRVIVEIDLTELVRALTDAASHAPVAVRGSEWVEAKTFQFGPRMFRRLAKSGSFPVTRVGRQTIARRCDVDAYFEKRLSPVPPRDASAALIDPVQLAATNGRVARGTGASPIRDEQPSNTQRLQRRTHAEAKNRNGSVPKR
jgi:hypothetical protein